MKRLKIKTLVLTLALLYLPAALGQFGTAQHSFRTFLPPPEKRLPYGPWWFSTEYSHSRFKFHSSEGPNENRYVGNGNHYALRLWRHWQNGWELSFGYRGAITDVSTHLIIAPFENSSDNRTQTDVFTTDIKKYWRNQFYIGGFGSYGLNRYAIDLQPTGDSRYNGDLWILGVTGGLIYPIVHNLLVGASVSLFYASIYQEAYNFSNGGTVNQPFFRLNTTNLIENFDIQYVVTKRFRPFVQFGLIEVLDYDPSRSIGGVLAPLTNFLPELQLKRFGYNLGAGFILSFSHFFVTAKYVYFTRGNEFYSKNVYLNLSLPLSS